ncbi:capsular polysaccharide biosynthesis protein [Sphingomicrobium clamense]|uniref:Capsular polysaccharide biosynthesis protein n=1 Tax=Sphingomicrobium clamense TaxID=2851013 RepID=A0ABS6V347_9SPHN|nr:hypothetical protein [Sphingomicrobium sp. B8]MBW0143964.1 hypothetical protein [Sphingomicrobium sp. B8]
MDDKTTMNALASGGGPKAFLGNPRAYFADSRHAPLVWLSYVLPGRSPVQSWARAADRSAPAGARDDRFPDVGADTPVTPSRKLSIKPSLAAFLGQWPRWAWAREVAVGDLVIGWGYRKSGRKAVSVAKRKGARHLLIEDGFLRSVDRDGAEIGIALDQDGIYYDASSNSRLFDLIRKPLSAEERERAASLATRWRKLGLSKYNGGRPYDGPLPDRFVLVIDQVQGDLSIRHGRADQKSFEAMLAAALEHDPDVDVVLKAHPDATGKPRKSHFDLARLSTNPRIHMIADHSHVASLIERAEAVFTVTSQVGFEVLMHGKPVHVFGMPFYAGWGLTSDALNWDGRVDVPLEQLVHAALIDYPRYWHPVRQQEIEAESAMDLVGANIALRRQQPAIVFAMGFSRWKRPFIADFLQGSTVRFVASAKEIPEGATLILWGRKPAPQDRDDLNILRIEDGFLRSSGLGANLVRPLSLVLDDVGIYYDASTPSRLEQVLQHSDYDDEQRERAANLRRSIIDARLNKYNLGGTAWRRPDGDRKVVLVVGQVEGDASIRFGSPDVRTNAELLKRVRAEHPDDYIVYKPHPDVLAGLRQQGTDFTAPDLPYDELIEHADPVALLETVDHVHTMTSLMGFEALLRGVKVTCHGLPFYAGWGLTDDRIDCPRRTAQRTLDELVHATLIDYPRYFSPRGRMFASPEDILVELADLAGGRPAQRSLPRRAFNFVVTRWVKWRDR